ncbi:hypothetical protein HJC23_005558 [Cyclotella cryptica]|uniref:Uncharacterized protein n=1 Tax=Cyclotella cryptica TaxID=29204 RepID=A0ABD3PXF5_9STRA|eukprot:CCRYP_010674-RA/>CCRYP_010674-RA protein AED:0.06 eAED:0.06 QI:0/-1/0/1/-1/1/1/0/1078
MVLPIRGLSSRASRGRSSSSDRSGSSSRFSRSRRRSESSGRSSSRSSSRGGHSESSEELSGIRPGERRASGRFARRSRSRSASVDSSRRGGGGKENRIARKKDALFRNYSKFMGRSRNSMSRRRRDDPQDRARQDFARIEDGGAPHHSSLQRAASRSPHDATRPFLVPPSQALSPRSDIWFAFAITSCAAVSSFAQLIKGASYKGSSADKFALSVTAISFAIGVVCAGGMRYAPFRNGFTSCLGGRRPSRRNTNFVQLILQQLQITPEIVTLSLLSLLWLFAIPTIANGSVQDLTLAVSGGDIWNANLFYSSWASVLLCWYLLVEVCTLPDKGGTVPRHPPLNSNYRGWNGNALSKRWTLVLLSSCVILSSTVKIYTGPMCSGSILKSTDYCSRALAGIMLGGFFQFVLCLGVGIVCRLASMKASTAFLNFAMKNKVTFSMAVISLLIQSINVGILTSPTGGGPATSSGSVYFASWMGFVLVFEMCLRYVEFFSTYGADGTRVLEDAVARRSTGGDGASTNGSEYSRRRRRRSHSPQQLPQLEQQPVMMIRNGSLGSSKRTVSTSDSEEHPVILQIVSDHPPPSTQAIGPNRGPPASSDISPMEPPDAFSIGSAPRRDPDNSSSGGGVSKFKSPREAFSRASSKGSSTKNPDGYYLEAAAAFGQQTSFHVDKLEELDQSKQQIHAEPVVQRRSKSPKLRNNVPTAKKGSSHRLTSLEEMSNEKSSPSTTAPEIESIKTKSPSISSSRPSSAGRPKSRGKPTTASRASSRQSSAARPNSRDRSRYNDSSSGTNDPPPTISDCDTTSEYEQPRKIASQKNSHRNSRHGSKKSSTSGTKSGASRGPPPPPFHRNNDTPNSGNAMPLQSVNTYSIPNFDMSEPTIDVEPTAQERKSSRKTMPNHSMMESDDIQESNSTESNDYGKKWSDSTEAEKTLQRSSSDENPSSHESHKDHVDDIVAAALAYAEKSHCEDGVRSTSAASSHRQQPHQRRGTHDESIHSFYSHSQAQSLGTPGQSSVEDMVARALSQAGDKVKGQRGAAAVAGQNKNPPTRLMSMESSMYSEYSERSGDSVELDGQFNC